MTNTVTIGRRLIPIEHIALVEPLDPVALARMQTQRPFKSRVVLIDRESVLSEATPEAFATMHAFRWLAEEGVAINPSIRFGVETFEAAEGFNPTKPYQSRLLWRDFEGNTQSKLLVTMPSIVLAVAVKGEQEQAEKPEPETRRSEANGRPSPRRKRMNASSMRPSPAS